MGTTQQQQLKKTKQKVKAKNHENGEKRRTEQTNLMVPSKYLFILLQLVIPLFLLSFLQYSLSLPTNEPRKEKCVGKMTNEQMINRLRLLNNLSQQKCFFLRTMITLLLIFSLLLWRTCFLLLHQTYVL